MLLKTWATTHNENLEPPSEQQVLSGELTQDCRAGSASIRDVVSSIGDEGSLHPGKCRYKRKLMQAGLTKVDTPDNSTG